MQGHFLQDENCSREVTFESSDTLYPIIARIVNVRFIVICLGNQISKRYYSQVIYSKQSSEYASLDSLKSAKGAVNYQQFIHICLSIV